MTALMSDIHLYRSDRFTRFLKKLDERAEKKHARFEHREGSPHDILPPDGAKMWMLKPNLFPGQATESDSGQEEEVEEDAEREESNDSDSELCD